MASVPKGGQTVQQSIHDKKHMEEMHREDRARDDLRGAFAGNQNENESARGHHGDHGNESHVKSRKTKASKERTPKL